MDNHTPELLRAAFVNATPRTKSAMVHDGIEHLNISMAKAVLELKTLNAWLEQMPGLLQRKQADPIDGEQIADIVSDFQLKVDLFNEQCIINSELTKKLAAYIKATQTK